MEMDSWVACAERRIRQLGSVLDGSWGVSLSLEPPLGPARVDDFVRSAPAPVPEVLADIYRYGCNGCVLRYHWSPAPDSLARIESVLPHQYSLYGGAEFLPWEQLRDSISYLSNGGTLGWENWDPPPRAPRRIPFLQVANGDSLVWVADDSGAGAVEYLSHDDHENTVRLISPSLEHFFGIWEQLYYLGPEIWLLLPFTNEDGLLDERHPNLAAWRELFPPQLED